MHHMKKFLVQRVSGVLSCMISIGTCTCEYLYKQIYWRVEYLVHKSISNRCWCSFNLAKSCSSYAYNSYETILALFKFGRQTKLNHQTAKLISPLDKLTYTILAALSHTHTSTENAN